MVQIGWRFPPLSGGTRQGYTNNDIEAFKGQEILDNLAREICQNSLDAHLDNATDPVIVEFETRHFERDCDVFEQYKKCLDNCRKYWKDEMDAKLKKFVLSAEATLNEDTIPIFIASDYNTKGLSGSHSHKKSSSWEALTNSDGVSVKSDDNSAGSYGIGKNAPFACSSLSMVFYNTVADNNESAFIGVARLATIFNENNKPTQRIGKYQVNDEENEIWEPIYPENRNDFRDRFYRDKRGTDVIIVGFTQTQNWIDNLTKAILKNFFVAIKEDRLVVKLKEDNEDKIIIDSNSLKQLFSNFANDNEMVGATQLYNAFVSPDNKVSTGILEKDDVEVYIKSDASYKRTIANFRSTGMLVGTYYKLIYQHYAAVIIVRGEKLGELLKDTEPPKHNKWDYKQIDNDKARKKLARESIQKIDDFVLQSLKEQYEVITEDTIDAAGVGDYIPDESGGHSGQSESDDILRVKIKIGKVKTNPTRDGITTQIGIQENGTEQKGDVHNRERNPNPILGPSPSKPVTPDPENQNPQKGATPGKGTKLVKTPNLTAQRAFPISSSQGLYKIVIKSSENYSNLFLECFAMGEDGNSDSLELESFTYNNENISFVGGKAGPMRIEANTPAVFFARFTNKEKMKLSLHLTEESK